MAGPWDALGQGLARAGANIRGRRERAEELARYQDELALKKREIDLEEKRAAEEAARWAPGSPGLPQVIGEIGGAPAIMSPEIPERLAGINYQVAQGGLEASKAQRDLAGRQATLEEEKAQRERDKAAREGWIATLEYKDMRTNAFNPDGTPKTADQLEGEYQAWTQSRIAIAGADRAAGREPKPTEIPVDLYMGLTTTGTPQLDGRAVTAIAERDIGERGLGQALADPTIQAFIARRAAILYGGRNTLGRTKEQVEQDVLDYFKGAAATAPPEQARGGGVADFVDRLAKTAGTGQTAGAVVGAVIPGADRPPPANVSDLPRRVLESAGPIPVAASQMLENVKRLGGMGRSMAQAMQPAPTAVIEAQIKELTAERDAAAARQDYTEANRLQQEIENLRRQGQ